MRLPLFLAALLALVLPGQAGAWNSLGHMIVAKLAYDELSDGQRAALFKLLQTHPHYTQHLAAHRPEDVGEVEWAVLRAAVWSDWIRPREGDRRGSEVTKFHRSEDHYINIPIVEPKDEKVFAGRQLIDPDKTDILCALKQRSNELMTRTAADSDKAVALCWLFHLVGDIHQPLHNASYFADRAGFTTGDLGGNKFGVRVHGRKVKLHAYWDDLLGDDLNYLDDTADRQQRLHRESLKLAEELRGRTLSQEDRTRLEKNLTFASWSQEGAELARKFCYQKTDGSGTLDGAEVRFRENVPESAPEVGPKYNEQARAHAEVRVILAGKRLAERLKVLLPP
jgi:hypothetical protein